MSKISIVFKEYAKPEERQHLVDGAMGAFEALSRLDKFYHPVRIINYIEVIRIDTTSWVPHGLLYVIMVMSRDGKKTEQSFVQKKPGADNKRETELWIFRTLQAYISNSLEESRTLVSGFEKQKEILEGLIPK